MNVMLWQAQFRAALEQRNYSPRTVEKYVDEVKPFLTWMAEAGVDSVGGIRREHLEGYRAFLYESFWQGRPITASTQAQRLAAVKRFLLFLTAERFLPLNPGAELDLPRVTRGLLPPLLSEKEAGRVMEGQDGSTPVTIRNRALLEVLYGTGLRNSEIRMLRMDQLDLEAREIRLRGKGDKARAVPLGELACRWLNHYLQYARPDFKGHEGNLLFLSLKGGPLSRNWLAVMVRRAAKAAGVKKRVTPHVLRAACVTHMLRHGASLRHLQKLLGHACIGSTERYTRLEVSDLRQVLEAFHPRERGVV
jgi:integrase/recombinase XerD